MNGQPFQENVFCWEIEEIAIEAQKWQQDNACPRVARLHWRGLKRPLVLGPGAAL
jgi:hypothetical protein